ncbi:hypothetical protein Pint_01620 [Pistacia integerrima]|uniref:Uncharacterized protein n=1 Tax=Pistacia integerrima TaxID=434235 RepID=A0ACC0ZN87_9ROSI|nr:hypothetical protein Pint_01620 [Pistacia integerrima]
MQRNCCHISFAFILKLLNYLQAFIGVSIIIYSLWMLDQWNHHVPIYPPAPSAPSPDISSSLYIFLDSDDHHQVTTPFNLMVSGFDDELGFGLNSIKLPAPWFIYSFMGVGILLCCITLIGCIAAEAISGCCLCFYAVLKTMFILLEAALVAFIAIDHHWEKDLPSDPTGELDSIRSFIEDNIGICKWIGITVVIIQALALLLAMVLRAMVSTQRTNFDEEDDFENARGRTWEPLLNSQSNQTSGSTHSDIWSSRIREKYGLNSGDKYSLVNNASGSMKSK